MANIYIVGFMGTGKTTVGKELAKRKGWNFTDLDGLIEQREKMPITEIFTRQGEPYFRRTETQVLKEVSQKADLVVACGGGIVMAEENIRIMKGNGAIICLTAKPGIILKRTSGYKHRPLLNVADPKGRIEELLKLRAPFYAKADYIIDTSDLTIDEAVEKINTLLGILFGK